MHSPQQPMVTVPASPSWLDALGRAGRGRIGPAGRGLRAVNHAILRSFAVTGHAPEPKSLEKQLRLAMPPPRWQSWPPETSCASIETGRITAAYPFSATPAAHRVQDHWSRRRVCHGRHGCARDRGDPGHGVLIRCNHLTADSARPGIPHCGTGTHLYGAIIAVALVSPVQDTAIPRRPVREQDVTR